MLHLTQRNAIIPFAIVLDIRQGKKFVTVKTYFATIVKKKMASCTQTTIKELPLVLTVALNRFTYLKKGSTNN